MDSTGLIRLSNVASVTTLIPTLRCQSEWRGWKHIVVGILEVFDGFNEGMTVDEMCKIIDILAPAFLKVGPFGGKTTRNTLSSTCTNGVKDGSLITFRMGRGEAKRFALP